MKFIPYEKLSKRGKREIDKRKRKRWGQINPITRITKNKKLYNRKNIRADENNDCPDIFFISGYPAPSVVFFSALY